MVLKGEPSQRPFFYSATLQYEGTQRQVLQPTQTNESDSAYAVPLTTVQIQLLPGITCSMESFIETVYATTILNAPDLAPFDIPIRTYLLHTGATYLPQGSYDDWSIQ